MYLQVDVFGGSGCVDCKYTYTPRDVLYGWLKYHRSRNLMKRALTPKSFNPQNIVSAPGFKSSCITDPFSLMIVPLLSNTFIVNESCKFFHIHFSVFFFANSKENKRGVESQYFPSLQMQMLRKMFLLMFSLH